VVDQPAFSLAGNFLAAAVFRRNNLRPVEKSTATTHHHCRCSANTHSSSILLLTSLVLAIGISVASRSFSTPSSASCTSAVGRVSGAILPMSAASST
jgi:hypothetical protein